MSVGTKYAYTWYSLVTKMKDPNFHVYVLKSPSGEEIQMGVHTVTNIAPTIGGTHPDYQHFTYAGEVVRFVRNF
jgi:hypothetical protein